MRAKLFESYIANCRIAIFLLMQKVIFDAASEF